MQLARSLAVGMIVVALAAACTSSDPTSESPTPEARPTEVAATSTPEPEHTVPPRPTPTPTPTLERIAPLEATVEPETAELGLVVFDLEAGTSWRSVGDPHAQPIRFEGETLLARIGNDIVRLDRAGEVIETPSAVGVTPTTNVNAPGLRWMDIDYEVSPDLRYQIERVDTRTAPGSGLNQPFYDVVLVDLEDGTRTIVARDQLRCQCDLFPRGAWSSDSRYFLDYGADRTVIIDASEGIGAVSFGNSNDRWSPTGELISASERGVLIGRDSFIDQVGDVTVTADGRFIGVSPPPRAADGSEFAIYRRDGLEVVMKRPGRIVGLVSSGDEPLAVVSDAAGCTGQALMGPERTTVCFEGASAKLAPSADVLVLYVSRIEAGTSVGEATARRHLEIYDLVTGDREVVFVAPSVAPELVREIFLLWSDDGTQLAIYWPWIYGV